MPTVSAPTRIKLQNILFATDFSSSGQAVLSYTLDLARRYDAGLYTVNVLPHMPFVEAAEPDTEQNKLWSKQQLAALIDSKSFKGVQHKGTDRRGRSSGSALEAGPEVWH